MDDAGILRYQLNLQLKPGASFLVCDGYHHSTPHHSPPPKKKKERKKKSHTEVVCMAFEQNCK